ncbi:efflux RND transporter periplasmic adaptor subunit [Cecembia rubra]|uniref:Cobalt-zinc-cadmium efflux system membrane fusion protein n=1 Tax=Cecembia rubra TaxID=1485585 RepID=A0A2P8E277_9BACT|nr:efflux RND transporter periplasmic adaptor subunit [Cecembia rubra]PSL03507.1 cobalt-zinc-cadmium efflux system membrane fusion protein [Cecembia rubra]
MKILSYILSIVLLGIFVACGSKEQKTQRNEEAADVDVILITQEQYDKSNMEMTSLQEYPFTTFILSNGIVNIPAEGRFEVSCYFGGNIVQFDLLVGQKVNKGQVLFVMENPEFVQMQQDYLDASSQLSYLKSDYERQKALYEENVTSQKNFLKAESDYKSMLAKAESLKKKLALINIAADKTTASNISSKAAVFAPISGYIESIKVNQGTYLNASDVALTLVNKAHLHIELNVFEKDAIALEIGQPVTFYLPDNKSKVFEGEIFLLGQSINEKRMLAIHVHLKDEKEGQALVPGMFVEAKIGQTSSTQSALPNTAVLNADSKNYVLLLEKKEADTYHFRKMEVELLSQDEGMSAIANPEKFPKGSQFLSKGGFQIVK